MENSITGFHAEDEPGLAELTGEFLRRQDERFDVHPLHSCPGTAFIFLGCNDCVHKQNHEAAQGLSARDRI